MKKFLALLWLPINTLQSILLNLHSIISVFGIMLLLPKKLVFVYACNIWSTIALIIPLARIKIIGKEKLEDDKNYIFMANHSSYADIPSIFFAINRRLHFIAKQELNNNFFLKPIMKKMEIILIDRSNAKKSAASMRKAIETIKNGKNIAIFPEGTRTKTGKLGNFKRGGFKLAIESGVSIVPIGIKGSAKVWPRNNLMFRPGKITLIIGNEIKTTGMTEQDVNTLSKKVKDEINTLIS